MRIPVDQGAFSPVAWGEEQIEEGTFGPDNAGIETVAAGGMHSIFVDEKGTVSNSNVLWSSYIDYFFLLRV
jgi:hypothetical protein